MTSMLSEIFGSGTNFELGGFPPTVRPVGSCPNPATWAAEHRHAVDHVLREHGVLLLRGFDVATPDAFDALASKLVKRLHGEYGDLPHEKDSDRIYQSTPYPPERLILFHHESSHMPEWPRRQFFCCIEPAAEGGATPIVDGRQVYSALPAEIRDLFTTKGICYIRNFIEGLDVAWPDMFGTHDRAEVEDRCRAQGVSCEWLPDGSLRTRQWTPAVTPHPETGEPVFFNQLLLHHPACLDEPTRQALLALFGSDESEFPRGVCYGDGSPIPDATVRALADLYGSLARRFHWQRGDVLVLDNMMVAHGRDPFRGDRKILVAMGDMITRADFAPAVR
jgi:alpha-ketoglutarate-dependent taurine dioxygenase